MEPAAEFDSWYRQQYKTVLAAAVVCAAGERALAEDATSDAFVKAFKKWNSVSQMDSPVAWTTTVAANRVRRLQRRRINRINREARTAVPEATTDSYQSDRDALWCSVAKLSPRQREALVLRYVHGATQAETAESLGIASGTAAATLNQARSRLHEELARNGSIDD